MCERAAGEGTPICSSRSKRPGRLRAGSSASGLLLAAITTTPATHAAAVVALCPVMTDKLDDLVVCLAWGETPGCGLFG